jgi:hypothetical protein
VQGNLGPIDLLPELPSLLNEGRPGFLCQGWKNGEGVCGIADGYVVGVEVWELVGQWDETRMGRKYLFDLENKTLLHMH